jgi:small conductance mechanosensitive channel
MDVLTHLLNELPSYGRLLVFAGIAAGTHLVVMAVRWIASHLASRQSQWRYRKLRSVGSLVTSALVFSLYFVAFGFILRELGVSLTAYLASASVIGLAVGFGSQGVVQDVVAGLTFIFSDLIDVGDLVEVSGETGVIRSIGMRFIELENPLGHLCTSYAERVAAGMALCREARRQQ